MAWALSSLPSPSRGNRARRAMSPPVIVHQAVEAGGPAPVQLVDGGGRAVAVLDAPLGPGKFLPGLHKGGAHAGEVNPCRQPVLGQHHVGGGIVVGLFELDRHQLIPEGQVVVGRHIADDLAGGPGVDTVVEAPGPHRGPDVPEGILFALHIAGGPAVENSCP